MTAGPVAATILARRVPAYRRRLPAEVARASPLVVGGLLGTAVWVGELPNSFLKRRLGIPPGERRRDAADREDSVLDQADWVPAAWLLLAPVWRMTPRQAAGVFAGVAAVHLPINVIGHAIGARDSRL